MIVKGNSQSPYALIALALLILLAGCAGVLSGTDSADTPTSTATPTPQPTPTATATATPTPTPSPTATPVPDHRDYEFYAKQTANLYDDYPPRDFLYDSSGSAEDSIVSVTVEKPEDWTVQDAEMEAARDLAWTAAVSTHTTVGAARENDEFLRPDTYRVRVVNQQGKILSKTSFDGDTAAAYATGDVTGTEFATQIAERRSVHSESATVSKREPKLALRAAEYRPIQYHHLNRIGKGNENLTTTPKTDIERAVILPKKKTLYYENKPPNNDIKYKQEGVITRTYLEAIKKIFESPRVNRYPHKVRVLTDVHYVRDESILTRIKTQWAFNYFAITNWTLPQNKVLSAAALDAYYNKIERNRKLIEDDDNYDYVAEVRDQDGNELNATVHDAYVLIEDDE